MPGSFAQISVILPFFNASGTLNEALQSIADQDFKDFECIMVDNNSRDGSREIAMQWKAKIAPGKVYGNPVSSLDIFATLAALSEAPINPEKPLDDWEHILDDWENLFDTFKSTNIHCL